jgi:hypothetical protein
MTCAYLSLKVNTRMSAAQDRCDSCENMARVTVEGYIVARYLCAAHAAALCLSVGDIAGADKFAALAASDRALV